jgi:hypothetical protein
LKAYKVVTTLKISVFQSSVFVIWPCFLIPDRCSNQHQNTMFSYSSNGHSCDQWSTDHWLGNTALTSLAANSPTQDLPDPASCHVLYEELGSRCNYWLKLGHSLLGRLVVGPAPPVGAQHGSVAAEAVDEAAMSCNIIRVQFKNCIYKHINFILIKDIQLCLTSKSKAKCLKLPSQHYSFIKWTVFCMLWVYGSGMYVSSSLESSLASL